MPRSPVRDCLRCDYPSREQPFTLRRFLNCAQRWKSTFGSATGGIAAFVLALALFLTGASANANRGR